MNFLQTFLTFDILGWIAVIILVSSFLEKIFDKKFIGSWFFGLGWRLTKFCCTWFMFPFRPQLDGLKAVIFQGKELEAKFLAYLEAEKEKTELLGELKSTLDIIKKEVSLNGGSSIKDAVTKLVNRDQEKFLVLKEVRAALRIIDLRQNIADEADNRMTFRMNDKLACTQISENFLRFFGYTEKDMKGMDWDFCIAPRQKSQVRKAWRTAVERRTPYRGEQIIIDSDGNEHHCLVRGFPLIEGDKFEFFGTVEILDKEEN